MSDTLLYRLLADLILILHFAFVVFVIGGLVLVLLGGAFGWRWVRNPWFRLAHLLAIGIVVAQAWLGVLCPLTSMEMALRLRAADSAYPGSFIAHRVSALLYYELPSWVFTVSYTAFGLLIVMSWFRVRPRSFSRNTDDA